MAIDSEVVAYHEAGHAVIAHALELPVDRITIESGGGAVGHVIHDYGCNMNEVIYEDGPRATVGIGVCCHCRTGG